VPARARAGSCAACARCARSARAVASRLPGVWLAQSAHAARSLACAARGQARPGRAGARRDAGECHTRGACSFTRCTRLKQEGVGVCARARRSPSCHGWRTLSRTSGCRRRRALASSRCCSPRMPVEISPAERAALGRSHPWRRTPSPSAPWTGTGTASTSSSGERTAARPAPGAVSRPARA